MTVLNCLVSFSTSNYMKSESGWPNVTNRNKLNTGKWVYLELRSDEGEALHSRSTT